MALLIIEPYARYAAVADVGTDNDDLTTAWSVDGGISLNTTAGRFSGRVLEVNQSAREQRIRLGTVSGTTLIVGAAIRWDSSGSTSPAASSILRCTTSSSATIHWQISIGMGGNLYIFSAGGSTLVGTVQGAIQHDAWHYLEVKVAQDNSGSMTIKIDGVQVFTISATDFQNASATFESVWFGGNHDNFYWEDVIIMDGSGSTFNDFMGDMRFECAVPDADGSVLNWTASAGTRVSCIDDALAAYNDDTDYISSNVTDDVNLASHGTISATNQTAVHFAALFALARADAAGDKLALVVKSGATTDAGADLALVNGTYRWRKKIWELDPNTAAAWTVANINSAEWGVKKRV